MLSSNTIFDVYRGYAPAAPYDPPQRPAALVGLQGYLHQHVRNGRFGYYPSWARAPFYWTTVLDVTVGTDGRDAYNTQLNADTIQNGDTILVYDYPIPGTCCAFVVSFVQRRGRGQTSNLQSIDYLRLYLDRAQPSWLQGCPDPNAAGGGGGGGGTITVPCSASALPATLHATISGISAVAGTYQITWNTQAQGWTCRTDIGMVCGIHLVVQLNLLCLGGIFQMISFAGGWGSPSSVTCSPLQIDFPAQPSVVGTCSGNLAARVTP